jgi:L-Ala-D/L-Glu epimerase
MQVSVHRVDWEYASVFKIAYRTWTHSETVVLEIKDDGLIGRGEALGVFYHNETIQQLCEQLESVTPKLIEGVSRSELPTLLGPGGARNAVDCALWDLEAKRAGRRAWELAGIESPRPLVTAYTLSVDTPEAMARAAAFAARHSLLKLKLCGDGDVERVSAVRRARPDAELIVDANQAWSEKQLRAFAPRLAAFDVKLIEQPLPLNQDDMLTGYKSPVPFCADESCQTSESIPGLLGKYEYVNIKLDKTGGLSEGLKLARLASERGLKLMVGCMGGSSLSMAPAFIVGQLCDFVDLDSPLLIKSDMSDAIRYDGSRMFPPEARLWG